MKKLIVIWFLTMAAGLAWLKAVPEKQRGPATFRDSMVKQLVYAARQQTTKTVTYDGSYRVIPYPGGDVPDSLGVCTDVIIRAYRKVGYDLQKLIHEDMLRVFSTYTRRRYSDRIDANIDHRRTPNMETYFSRFGTMLPVTQNPKDYEPGDIVFWKVAAGHVGIVSEKFSSADSLRHLIIHNIGSGPHEVDFLFDAPVTGHYRYQPWKKRW